MAVLRLPVAPMCADSIPTSPICSNDGHRAAGTSHSYARELQARGYRGSYASVRDHLVRRLPFDGRKTPAGASSQPPLLPTPRQAAFLFLRCPEELRPQEQESVNTLRQLHTEVDLAYDLVQQF